MGKKFKKKYKNMTLKLIKEYNRKLDEQMIEQNKIYNL